jgi:hypothetical protein
MNNGKKLEELVAHVEKRLLGQGFDVKTNKRVFDADGVQLAEFDIEIRGKVGSTEFAWLIECRDRPGHGAAPVSWIEQLYGRRNRFNFNKVTAVSTTGFSEAASKHAREVGIELREVRELDAQAFDSWLQVEELQIYVREARLIHASVIPDESASDRLKKALVECMKGLAGDSKFLRKVVNGEIVTASAAFLGVVNDRKLFDELHVEAGAAPMKLQLLVNYEPGDHFVIDTDEGEIRVQAIEYQGELVAREDVAPMIGGAEYVYAEGGEVIAQIARFAPHQVGELNVALEVHRIEGTGEIQLLLRRH